MTTHCGATNVPPQKPNEPRINIACQGQSPAEALVPPTMRVFGLSPQEPKNYKAKLCTIRATIQEPYQQHYCANDKMFKSLKLIQKNRTGSIETGKKNEKMRTGLCSTLHKSVKHSRLLFKETVVMCYSWTLKLN